MLYRVRFSYTDEAEGIFQAENEEHLLAGFMEIFSSQLEDVQIIDIEEVSENEMPFMAPTSEELN